MAGLTKLDLARNPELRVRCKRKVQVPRGTKKIYIPRKKHYSPHVYGEDNPCLEAFYDKLEPCIVTRGLHGWGWHKCPYHDIYIEEKAL